ncbi:hypothetical protein FAZ95_26160 [Trinickia violacea]|uniref:Uncharacterized protein n=1 Tax=Trinickia violacea TaxID=2571746 RepID=A0A4P8J1M1_9BURK|nr:hypothetical protein FAZ95_26160 [Trinickia violacea]
MRFESAGLAAIFLLSGACAWAGDFDGSKPLLCATIDGHACDPGLACERALPADLGAPRFLSIDFTKKIISGPNRATPIVSMSKAQGQILMQGTELDFAWTVALDTSDGEITLTLTNRHDALVLFGDCTAM